MSSLRSKATIRIGLVRLQAWKEYSSRTFVSCLVVFLGRTIEWRLADQHSGEQLLSVFVEVVFLTGGVMDVSLGIC